MLTALNENTDNTDPGNRQGGLWFQAWFYQGFTDDPWQARNIAWAGFLPSILIYGPPRPTPTKH